MKSIDFLPLVVNIVMFSIYLWHFEEPGKILYWLGAVLLTAGLVLMKG